MSDLTYLFLLSTAVACGLGTAFLIVRGEYGGALPLIIIGALAGAVRSRGAP